MPKRDLDEDVPLGDPGNVFCRWCGTGRVLTKTHQGVICVQCDTNTNPLPGTTDTTSGSV